MFVPAAKELMYFNRDGRYEPSLRRYREHFVDYAGQKRIGESTPLYLSKGVTYAKNGDMRFDAAEDAVVRIARHIPEAQLIISLRDPMTRMVSEYEKNVAQGKYSCGIDEILVGELAGERLRQSLLYHNKYETHLRHIFDHFPEAQVKLLIFEEWTADLEGTIASLQAFLGLEPRLMPIEELNRNARSLYMSKGKTTAKPGSNISANIRARVLEHLRPSREYLERIVGRELPWERLDDRDQRTKR